MAHSIWQLIFYFCGGSCVGLARQIGLVEKGVGWCSGLCIGSSGVWHFVVLSGGISGRMKALSELIFIAVSIEFLAEFVPR